MFVEITFTIGIAKNFRVPINFSASVMAQPNLAPKKPKKKRIQKNQSQKQLAKEKYKKTLNEFKVYPLPPPSSPPFSREKLSTKKADDLDSC